jgi:hypothetical protein
MKSGRLAELSINVSSNTTARQKKAAARRQEEPLAHRFCLAIMSFQGSNFAAGSKQAAKKFVEV